MALEWVARLDEQERGIWVEQFQNSTWTPCPEKGSMIINNNINNAKAPDTAHARPESAWDQA